MRGKLSHHDVTIYSDGFIYRPSENYALHLTCCRVTGWQLWYKWGDEERLVCGEFEDSNGPQMCITVAGNVILGVKPEIAKPSTLPGWEGKNP